MAVCADAVDDPEDDELMFGSNLKVDVEGPHMGVTGAW